MKKVLIIDDEEKLRMILARIIRIEGEGFEVQEAKNIKTATKKLAESTFHVAICDVKLPDGNGVQFIKDVKAMQPHIEIIMLTAYGNIPDGVQAIKNGLFIILPKAMIITLILQN